MGNSLVIKSEYCIVRFDYQKEVITYFAFYNGGIICCRGKSSFHIRIYFLSMGYLMLDDCVVPWQTYPNSWNCSWFQSSINRFKWGFISLPPLRVKFAKFFWQTKQISWHAVPTRTVRMVATCCNKKPPLCCVEMVERWTLGATLGGWIVSNFARVLALAWSWCQYIECSNDCSVDLGDLGVPANMVYHGLPVYPRVAISCNFSGENHDEPWWTNKLRCTQFPDTHFQQRKSSWTTAPRIPPCTSPTASSRSTLWNYSWKRVPVTKKGRVWVGEDISRMILARLALPTDGRGSVQYWYLEWSVIIYVIVVYIYIHIHDANTYPNYQLLSLYSDNGLLFHFFLIIYFWPPRMIAMTSAPPEDVAA